MKRGSFISVLLLAVCLTAALIYIFTSSNVPLPESTESGVVINEIMTSNKGAVPDGNGNYPDWVEFYNTTSKEVDISAYGLSDDILKGVKWVFPEGSIIKPHGYLIVYCSGNANDGPMHTGFKLSAADDLIFSDTMGNPISTIGLKAVASGKSLSLVNGSWEEMSPSPGFENTAEGAAAFEATLLSGADVGVFINEVMASNSTTIMDEYGVYSDWIELYNSNGAEFDLSGFGLSDDTGRPMRWTFPEGTKIPGKGFLLVFCSGQTTVDDQLHASFSLRAYEESAVLCAPNGRIVDSVDFLRQQNDRSIARQPDGTGDFEESARPTPGYPNTEEGFNLFQATNMSALGDVYISEVLTANYTYLKAENGEFYDFIELHNKGAEAVSLEGFALTDNPNNPAKWVFPAKEIGPGEYLIVLASGNDVKDTKKKYLETNFKLSADGDILLLFDKDGKCLDKLQLGQSRADVSYGRTDGIPLYYSAPTPGEPNSNGLPGYAPKPLINLEAGAYSGPQEVFVDVPDGCLATFTLDGSVPQKDDPAVSGPITIDKTSVLRVRTFKDGLYAGDIATATYLIDSPHTLPVVSLVTDPPNLWDEHTGIYTLGPQVPADAEYPYKTNEYKANFFMEWERPVYFDVIGEDGNLEIGRDAIFRIFGDYSRGKEQKAFAIVARAGYGGSAIDYPLFDDREFDSYKSVVLRASGQDSTITRMRDIVITSLVGDSTDLVVQAYRQCVVYLNGKYWGVYNLREKINKYFLAQHYGISDPDTIDLLVGNGTALSGANTAYKEMLEYATSHDLSQKEHYDYISSLVDVKNLAEYTAMEIYVGNTDSGNIKYWRAPGRKWQWITYDFCWAMNSSSTVGYQWNAMEKYFSEKGHGVGGGFSNKLIKALLKNPEFEKIFLKACSDMVNKVFAPEKVIARVNECEAAIDEEMKRDTEKWEGMSYTGWKKSVDRLREFALNRPSYFIAHTKAYFNLTDSECNELFGASY